MSVRSWIKKIVKPRPPSLVLTKASSSANQSKLPPSDRRSSVGLFLKRCPLYHVVWHSSISPYCLPSELHEHRGSLPWFEFDDPVGEKIYYVSGQVVWVNKEDYHPEIYDTNECNFLKEIVTTWKDIDNELVFLYKDREAYMVKLSAKCKRQANYCLWAATKIFVQLIEDIYSIVFPLIKYNLALKYKLKENETYKELMIPVNEITDELPMDDYSSVDGEPPSLKLMRADRLKDCLQYYLNLIEGDVDHIRTLLKLCSGSARQHVIFNLSDFPEGSSVIEFGSNEFVKYRMNKLIDFTTFQKKIKFLLKDENMKKSELNKVNKEYMKLCDEMSKKYQRNPDKLQRKLHKLKFDKLLQEYLIEDRYWMNKVNYERSLEWDVWVSHVTIPFNRINWGDKHRQIDLDHSKMVESHKNWLRAAEIWEKRYPEDLRRQVQFEIENEIEDKDGDGDPSHSIMPLDVGSKIKMNGFVKKNDVSELQMQIKGSIIQTKSNFSSINVLKRGINLSDIVNYIDSISSVT